MGQKQRSVKPKPTRKSSGHGRGPRPSAHFTHGLPRSSAEENFFRWHFRPWVSLGVKASIAQSPSICWERPSCQMRVNPKPKFQRRNYHEHPPFRRFERTNAKGIPCRGRTVLTPWKTPWAIIVALALIRTNNSKHHLGLETSRSAFFEH